MMRKGVRDQESGMRESAGAIEVRGFSFSYGGRSVLRDVSFTIPRRGVTARNSR